MRAKVYSYKLLDDKEKMRLKGVSQNYTEREMTHAKFKEAFEGGIIPPGQFYQIESKKHCIKTVQKTKSTIVFYNDKKYFTSKNTCFSYGNKNIVN